MFAENFFMEHRSAYFKTYLQEELVIRCRPNRTIFDEAKDNVIIRKRLYGDQF